MKTKNERKEVAETGIVDLGFTRVWTATASKLMQKLLDKVFGKNVVKVDKGLPLNNITLHLKMVDDHTGFTDKLKERLERLKEGFEDTSVYGKLLMLVKALALPGYGEEAYAMLAAWDLLEPWSRYRYGATILQTDESTAESCDSWIEHYGYDAEWMAEMTKDLVVKIIAERNTEGKDGVVVLVRAPWVSKQNGVFHKMDYDYFRELAKATFFGFIDDDNPAKELIDDYEGEETMEELSERVTGIVVIDEIGSEDGCVCHSFWNPNSHAADDEDVKASLKDTVEFGDVRGGYEGFEGINYDDDDDEDDE